jgi:hypothetical protein
MMAAILGIAPPLERRLITAGRSGAPANVRPQTRDEPNDFRTPKHQDHYNAEEDMRVADSILSWIPNSGAPGRSELALRIEDRSHLCTRGRLAEMASARMVFSP